MAQSFRDLQIWQKSMQLAVEIYRLTRKFPPEEVYGLTSQIRRAAISIPSNIAEGHGRMNPKEFRYFLGIARGSVCEVQTQLELAQTLEFGSKEGLKQALELSHEVGKMLFSFLDSLKNQI